MVKRLACLPVLQIYCDCSCFHCTFFCDCWYLDTVSDDRGFYTPFYVTTFCDLFCDQMGWFGLVWVDASPRRPDPRSAQPSLRDLTALGAPGCRKACRTADTRQTVRWRTQEGDTTVPVCVTCALLGCLWVLGRGEARACGVVCCLVLQAPAGRQWAPDAKPAGVVVGLDTPPPGALGLSTTA